MKLRLLLGALLLNLTGASALVKPVEITPQLKGEWIQPDKDWKGKAVLMLHGLADDMDGPSDMNKHMAVRLAERGIATLRINFRGEGDKKRTKIESTFLTRIEDTETAAAYLKMIPGVSSQSLGLFGSSLGGATALEVASRQPESFRAMVTWVTLTGDYHALMVQPAPLKKAADEADQKGWGEADMGWKKLQLSKAFFDSFQGFHSETEIAKYTGAYLTVRGSEDFLPQGDAQLMKQVKGRPSEACVIAGADHIFNVFQPELGYAARATDRTVEWFVQNLP